MFRYSLHFHDRFVAHPECPEMIQMREEDEARKIFMLDSWRTARSGNAAEELIRGAEREKESELTPGIKKFVADPEFQKNMDKLPMGLQPGSNVVVSRSPEKEKELEAKSPSEGQN